MRVIAGPCAIEGIEWFIDWAGVLNELAHTYKFELVIKGSFDKANRSELSGPRGVGFHRGLEALQRTRDAYGVKVTTDIHESWQAPDVARVVDVIQIPAFLMRQTDLLVAAAKTGRIVNIKKAQWASISDMNFASRKVAQVTNNSTNIWMTHRGSLSGRELWVPVHELLHLRQDWGAAATLDVTHTNHGDPAESVAMLHSARAIGFQSFFMEVHPNPPKAICDAKHQLSLNGFKRVLDILQS